ncbi:hypothetical protein [Candidatus Enterococcus lemimoniae]|uniref:Uncharacterized protein n=1 Tax=Candidatus Enterococcus lemimoniae TaxID=1834167 RepID=A0ABZ2T625_9ENTE|nr:hypothetical protein [Enterococcus sp. 12C11_DIV0727]OTO67934.1 hypothetical protein A5866_000129 [Enterococcus sp. 12C11_DIV0727]
MKNIKTVILDKYRNKQNYEELENGIYKDLKNKRYVITLRFEIENNENSQYPLEDILDKYYVNCTSHIVEDGNYLEVELEDGNDDNFESFDTIKEIASLEGKRVYNKEDDGYIKLVIE